VPTAADVPRRFDCVINGEGYITDDQTDAHALYGLKDTFALSPTFVQRQNVQGDYGDETQDFWLTWAQRDWSLGEDQRYFRQSDDQGSRRYFTGTNADVRVPGSVSMRYAKQTVTFPTAPVALSGAGLASSNIFAATASNLYEVDPSGTITDRGVHGLGATPSQYGLANDGSRTYISTTTGGTVGIRKWNGASFSTFSANGADALAFHNNTLYGLRNSSCDLVRWDTSGTLTSLFPWRTADGGSLLPGSNNGSKLLSYGSDLLIYMGGVTPTSLWLYDGTGTYLLHRFDPGFVGSDAVVSNGVCFVAGVLQQTIGGSTYGTQAVYYFAQGTPGLLWKSQAAPVVGVSGPRICAFDSGVVWADGATNQYMYWNLADGGVQRFGASTVGTVMVGAQRTFMYAGNLATADLYPGSTKATTTTITHSLTDFDSSLDKLFRGVKVSFDSATDGDGGSVDISYRVGDVSGSYTGIKTGATSGVEYPFLAGPITGRSLSIKVTLNRGTSTNGPVLKRTSVRAAPIQTSFRKDTFVLNCSGRDGKQMLTLRDGTQHTKDGLQMATDLRAAAVGLPITITDEFGTFTGVIENDGFELRRVRRSEYIAVVPFREV
jgi:hypothetical protein